MFNFDRVTFKIYQDDTARFEGLKAGEFDFMREFSSRNWARQYTGRQFDIGRAHQEARSSNRNPGDFQGYVFNLRSPKFKDIRVRQAIGLAMDFEWLNRQLFYGAVQARARATSPTATSMPRACPEPDELALLEPLREQLRPEVFGPRCRCRRAPRRRGSLRENLRKARGAAGTKPAGPTATARCATRKGEAFDDRVPERPAVGDPRRHAVSQTALREARHRS